jgi:hypothetical protein
MLDEGADFRADEILEPELSDGPLMPLSDEPQEQAPGVAI